MSSILLFLLATALPPKPTRYVSDNAGVLGAARADALNAKLAQFERDTSDQVLVYVDRDLPPDTTIEEMGAEAIRAWGVGQKGKDNGAILFVFTNPKKMRIEVGYGLESTLTDAKSKHITSTIIKPLFQSGDMAGGIEAGTDAMLTAIRHGEYTGTGKTHAQATTSSTTFPYSAMIFFAFLIIVVFVAIMRRSRFVGVAPAGVASTSSSDDSWSSSSSDSSSSDSDFSGGGGDGGGGGASDSW